MLRLDSNSLTWLHRILQLMLMRRLARHGYFAKLCRHCSQLPKRATADKGSAKEELLHHPVMVKEVLENLYPQNGDVILDMTFGAGGHTKAILDKFEACKVIALDRDPNAFNIAKHLAREYNGKLIPLLGRFSELGKLLEENGIESISGALLDAGCSSMQLEIADRGFSLARDGPLDMRMDGDRFPDQPTAADVVNRLNTDDLAKILAKYGEEKYAEKIARHLTLYRSMEGPITRTQQLADAIAGAFDSKNKMRKDSLNRRAHIGTKSFMAIRIFVNDELNELIVGLKTVEKYMRPGGRLVAITFHSLEDRIVKRVLMGSDVTSPSAATLSQKRKQGTTAIGEKKWMPLKKKVVVPQFDEIDENARSRSAKLRSATRI